MNTTTTTATFYNAAEAVSWINSMSGLWSGMSSGQQDDCYDSLATDGRVSWMTPVGDVFTAVICC